MNDLLLSICMMVKNEEDNLPRCLESLKPLLSKPYTELIIIDTGSSDRTVEISRKYTSKVFYHPWNNHFAEMRNISISYAKGEWLFIIDADEELVNPNELITFLEDDEQKEYNSVQLSIKSFTNSSLTRYSINPNLRIFRNDKEFKYVGSVHNQPLFKKPIKYTNIILNHYGYFSDDNELMEKKFNRTSELLKAELEKSPNNIYYRFQLARSYLMHNDIIEGYNEIKKAYKILTQMQKQVECFYVYGDYIRAALRLNRFEEAKAIAIEAIKIKTGYIDAYAYLGLAQFQTGEKELAIENFKYYMRLYDNRDFLKITNELTSEIYTLTPELHSEISLKMANYYYDKQRYKEALEAAYLALDNKHKISLVIKSLLAEEKYQELKDYYCHLLTLDNKTLKSFFVEFIERETKNNTSIDFIALSSQFASIDDEYGFLNKIRISVGNEQITLIKEFLQKYDFHELTLIYVEIFEILITQQHSLIPHLKRLKTSKIKQIVKYLIDNFDKEYFIHVLTNSNQWMKEFQTSRVYTAIANVILLNEIESWKFNPKADAPLISIFETYVEHGIYLCRNLYQTEKFRLIYESLENDEHKFFILISLAQDAIQNNNTKLAIKYFRKSTEIYPYMSSLMKFYQDQLFSANRKEDPTREEDISKTVALPVPDKDAIKKYIENGELEKAKVAIEQNKRNYVDDVEFYSMEAVIAILENKFAEAETILNNGLKLDPNNFDILFNLAYVHEKTGRYDEAICLYEQAKHICTDKEVLDEINVILQRIKRTNKIEVKQTKKYKLVFFIKKGINSFVDDIVKALSKEYETKFITVSNFKQIDNWMAWADISWFEWCDELIAYGSKLDIAKEKKLICRLHSYEAFTNHVTNVQWENVNITIFVAEHIRDFVLDRVKSLNRCNTTVIPNGIDLTKFKFRNRKPGFNIAYVGYINHKKGPMLLLHVFKAIFDTDNRYKLYIAGTFQEPRYALYFNHMIQEMGLQKNVFYEGWKEDIDNWLDDKDYIISTSLLESQHLSVMEAMSKGIKPVIHNFVGAMNIYPKKYIWNTIDEAVEIVTNFRDYHSFEYRQFIQDNYNFNMQLTRISNLIKDLQGQAKNSCITISNDSYNRYFRFKYNDTEVSFYLPYVNDYIQSAIARTGNFYEIAMLEDIKGRISDNSIIIDVGANIGNHTVFFGKFCAPKHIYAFEPHNELFNILNTNVSINGLENIVSTFNVALGHSKGKGNLLIRNNSNLGMTQVIKDNKGPIVISTLDDILLNSEIRVDLLKIDVEGMALDVLKGAKYLIAKFRPIIYVEAETEEEFNLINSFLSKFDYNPISRFNATPTYLFIGSIK